MAYLQHVKSKGEKVRADLQKEGRWNDETSKWDPANAERK